MSRCSFSFKECNKDLSVKIMSQELNKKIKRGPTRVTFSLTQVKITLKAAFYGVKIRFLIIKTAQGETNRVYTLFITAVNVGQ